MPRFDLESYVQVKERIKKFRADHPDWALRSTIEAEDERHVIMHGWVENECGTVVADGHAEEIRGSSNVNQTSALENCETSAWGRALANLGYEVDRSIASREEMEKAARSPGPKARGGAAKAGKEESPAPPSPPAAEVELPTLQLRLVTRAKNLGTDKLADLKAFARGKEGYPFDGDALQFDKLDRGQVAELDAWVTEVVTPDPADEPF